MYRNLVARLLTLGLTCRSNHTILHRVAASHTESSIKKISVNFDKFYNMNARFYFRGPAFDMGSTCGSICVALQRVAANHTELSLTNLNQLL